MTHRKIYFIALLGLAHASSAQVPLNSVVEHFTNTKCSVCASRNPGLQHNLEAYPSISTLSIHPSSPYSGCILSMQNKADNDARTTAYGIYGSTPRIVINGKIIAAAADYSASSTISPYVGLSSPVSIRVMHSNVATDSIQCTITIKKFAATPDKANLFIGLAEDTVFVDGGNGEKMHYNVLRKTLSESGAISVALDFPVGDSITIHRTAKQSSVWNLNRMFGMALLFDPTSQELIQSGKSSPLKSPTHLAELSKMPTFAIFPNPADQTFNISTENSDTCIVNIFSLLGNKISTFSVYKSMSLNTQQFSNGIYIVEMHHSSGTIRKKIIIQH